MNWSKIYLNIKDLPLYIARGDSIIIFSCMQIYLNIKDLPLSIARGDSIIIFSCMPIALHIKSIKWPKFVEVASLTHC